MPSAGPVANRRSVLAGGAALAALGVVAAACGEAPPKPAKKSTADVVALDSFRKR